MNKKHIYTVGYTLFQEGNIIDVNRLFDTLRKYGINFLIDVRSVPFSKQYPQCNADNMKIAGKELGIPYMNMPELALKQVANKRYSPRHQIYFLSKKFFQ